MQKIDGRALANSILSSVKTHCAASSTRPGLAIVLVGDDPASVTYVRLKEEAAAQVGIHAEVHRFPATVDEATVVQKIQALNANAAISGMIVQLPLPNQLNADTVVSAIDPAKDADGFHKTNLERYKQNVPGALAPGLCEGVLALAQVPGVPLDGKKAVVLANGPIFAEPMAMLLTRAGLDVTLLYPPFRDFAQATKDADLIVIALGKAGFLKAEHTKPDVIIVDVGFNRVDGKVVGDVDAASMANQPGWLTPVPGGVGPVTVAMLLERTLRLAEN
ncbi:MAG: bifunctional 5,10-methylenetetrahydrofolate dehydrogenase/5,10-methenyltetrahydrofolate cyclohydrolase [Patescibacteria group bacterium]|jgi:methylenetetrahydrofolate dehydrogenase (NADP+)/methenyltetrahydrofolate cyclohydrolase